MTRKTFLIKVIYIIALVILDSDLNLAFSFHDYMSSNSSSLILNFRPAVDITCKDIQIKSLVEEEQGHLSTLKSYTSRLVLVGPLSSSFIYEKGYLIGS